MTSSPAQSPGADLRKAPSVLIVILNWNSHEETLTVIESVLQMDSANFRIVIIDNGSTDDSVTFLKEIISERVQLILSPENIGFTGGCNLGFDLALRENADYVWMLNNDSVTRTETLSSMIQLAEADSTIGLVSPMVASLQEPSKLLNAGGIYHPEIPIFSSTRKLQEARDWAATRPNQVMLMGTALLVRVSLIRKIGKLDPAMFAYWEDTDFSLRSIQAGFRNVVDFNSVIYHKEKSAGTEAHSMKPHYWYYMARNEIRFWKKHAKLSARAKTLWWAYESQLSNLRLLRGNKVSRQAILAGLWD
ncbi:MAG: glycosyltransferase family 2 protein, partial [Edaphobacter sp.]